MARKLTPIAIAYDFDGTLAPGNMQEYDFIPALKMKSKEFWDSVKTRSKEQNADEILAYMCEMLVKAQASHVPVRKSDFRSFGANISLFPGVLTWFDRVNDYARAHDCRIEHFIISSGLREMIEGTRIFRHFKKVYGSGFMFDHNGVAHWPAVGMNYTAKTQYLFRINKGSLDVHDNSIINTFVPMTERPVPFQNMIYVGDGETDVPCMRLVKDLGGHSIAVFNPLKRKSRQTAERLVHEGRATLSTPANYEAGSPIERAVQAIVQRISASAAIGRAAQKDRRLKPDLDPGRELSE